jgi:hypothetical protein
MIITSLKKDCRFDNVMQIAILTKPRFDTNRSFRDLKISGSCGKYIGLFNDNVIADLDENQTGYFRRAGGNHFDLSAMLPAEAAIGDPPNPMAPRLLLDLYPCENHAFCLTRYPFITVAPAAPNNCILPKG